MRCRTSPGPTRPDPRYIGPAGFGVDRRRPDRHERRHAGAKIVGDLTITDVLNQTPNRCTFRVRGLIPAIGQDVGITRRQ